MQYRLIVDYNPDRAQFTVELEDGSNAAFTLHSHAVIKKGMGVEGSLAERGPVTLMLDNRQHLKAFGETGPTNRGTCRQLVWPA